MEQKYRRVAPPKARSPEDEIRVAGGGRITNYVTYAARLFNELDKKLITVRATGRAIASAVSVCEVIRRRFYDLHQVTEIGVTQVTDEFEPTEEGLDPIKQQRTVPYIAIKLTKDESLIDKTNPGYQEPLPAEMVSEYDPERVSARPPRGYRMVNQNDYRPPRIGRRPRQDRNSYDNDYVPRGPPRGRYPSRGGGYGYGSVPRRGRGGYNMRGSGMRGRGQQAGGRVAYAQA